MTKLLTAVVLLLVGAAVWLRTSNLFPRAAPTSPINVMNYGATGNGTTDDTAAINSAISALRPGDTLSFPCGTYLTTSQLTINTSNVTVDGGSCAIIRNTAAGTIMVNAATARMILNPLTGVTVKNITFDGNGSNVYGFTVAGVAESTVSGVTSRNVQGPAIITYGNFNVAWSNITVTGAGSGCCGSAVLFGYQGNLSVNGMSISKVNPGATGTGCLYNGAAGFGLFASANSTITGLTVDAAGAYGRPFKTIAARWHTYGHKHGRTCYLRLRLQCLRDFGHHQRTRSRRSVPGIDRCLCE